MARAGTATQQGPHGRLRRLEGKCNDGDGIWSYAEKMFPLRQLLRLLMQGRPRALLLAALLLLAAVALGASLLGVTPGRGGEEAGARPDAYPAPPEDPLPVRRLAPPTPDATWALSGAAPSRLARSVRAGYGLAATAVGDVEVFDQPEGALQETFPYRNRFGAANVFLILAEALDAQGKQWYEVYLPRRPNGTRGWIAAGQVEVFRTERSVHVDVSDRRLRVFERGRLLDSFPVAVGKAATPTPRGEFFVVVQVEPPDKRGPYGPLALGLSAFSDVLTWWAGGGQAAIHGTNAPGAIGQSVSNGCIRMLNEDILKVGSLAGPGTPVYITN